MDTLTKRLDDMFLEEMLLDDLMKGPSHDAVEKPKDKGGDGSDDSSNPLLGAIIYISDGACGMYNELH